MIWRIRYSCNICEMETFSFFPADKKRDQWGIYYLEERCYEKFQQDHGKKWSYF